MQLNRDLLFMFGNISKDIWDDNQYWDPMQGVQDYIIERIEQEEVTSPDEIKLLRALNKIEIDEKEKELQEVIDENLGKDKVSYNLIDGLNKGMQELKDKYLAEDKKLEEMQIKLEREDDDTDPAGGHGLKSHE